MGESTQEPSPPASIEALRGDAVTDLDLLMQSAAALRAQLRIFETALRKPHRLLDRGGPTADLHKAIDIISVRETLTQAAVDFEAARHASRLSIFRLQLAEGMSLGAIARAWGFSRQLVSRMLKEDRPDPPNES